MRYVGCPHIMNTLVNDLKCLGTLDVIVVNGGSNDIGSRRNRTQGISTYGTIHTRKLP